MKVVLAFTVILFACLVNAQEPREIPCMNGDVKCAFEARAKSPVKSKSFWSTALAKPVVQRVGIAPDELLVRRAKPLLISLKLIAIG